MLEGQFVLRMSGPAYYSTPFAALGQTGTFTALVSGYVGAASTLNVTVEMRNVTDTAWVVAGAFAPIAADGTYALTCNPLKQLLRIKMQFTGGGGATTDGA